MDWGQAKDWALVALLGFVAADVRIRLKELNGLISNLNTQLIEIVKTLNIHQYRIDSLEKRSCAEENCPLKKL
jgi:predicted DNA-binding ArsR family transcriptional regulator